MRKRPGGVPRDPAVKDQLHAVRPAEVQILPNEVLEEQPAAQRAIQHLGETELGLQDGQLVAIARLAIPAGEGMRQAVQPLAKEGVDLVGRQPVAQGLQPPRVGTRQDPVVQGLEGDPPLGELPLHVLVAVEAELGGVGEVGAELQEERPEVPIHGVEVEVVDQGRGATSHG